MQSPPETKFAKGVRKILLSMRRWPRGKNLESRQRRGKLRLAIPSFDAEDESLFWEECRAEVLITLKLALFLGTLGFLAFMFLDLYTKNPQPAELLIRCQITLVLSGLLARLHYHQNPITQIAVTAKLAAGVTILSLICALLIPSDPNLYTETWVSLLPIYFFMYGQLFMPISETLVFGWLAMLMLPLAAFLIGVDSTTLIQSIIILLLVNLFGFCTRWQLESHSRMAFLAKRKAEATAQNKTNFLHYLSHNLRQPLQALCCYSSLLDTACAESSGGNLQHIVCKLGYTIDELNKAFNNILHFANLENGKQQPFLKAVDINIILSALEAQFAPQAAKRNLNLKIHFRTRPPYNVWTDSSILSQIIGNLIDNAIKYTSNGWVVVKVVNIGGRLKLHVRDNGIGITEQQAPNIFKEFYRAPHRRGDPITNGLGIGLAYVAKAVHSLPRHRLAFYSKPGLGSDFQIELPIAENPVHNWQAGEETSGLAGRFIFIVDDDLDVLEALARQLTSCGCLVETASSRIETLSALTDYIRPPDLLISDFYLGNKETAHDIIDAVFTEHDPLPVLILSAHAISNEDKAKLPKNTQLLRKPANSEILREMIAKAIG